MKSIIEIKPRYQETDKMGVVHHSVYAIWYEMGRVDFCDQIGIPFHIMEERGMLQAMVELTSAFKKPTYFGKKYFLTTQVDSYTRVKLVFKYELFDEEGVLVHSAKTLLAWLGEDFLPMNLEKKNPEVYRRIAEAHEEEQ